MRLELISILDYFCQGILLVILCSFGYLMGHFLRLQAHHLDILRELGITLAELLKTQRVGLFI